MTNRANDRRNKMRAAAAKESLMLNYPADFAECGCIHSSLGGVAIGHVRRDSATQRTCLVCGVSWEGDRKRHKNMPALDWREKANASQKAAARARRSA
jgi:hypothetical protein